jgi:hypothetical protein
MYYYTRNHMPIEPEEAFGFFFILLKFSKKKKKK